nr:unnamed protein product [Callosobruchus analis]
MYRQVLIASEQRDLQRTLWRENSSKPLQTFKLNTVTYGTASAAYLATRCIKQLGLQVEESFPEISRVLLHDFYFDDLLTAVDSVDAAIFIYEQVSKVLRSGYFELRKWQSNFGFGLLWSSKESNLSYSLIQFPPNTVITKRVMLSEISQIYDKLGLFSACTVLAKITLQQLWLVKLSWDEIVPDDVLMSWCKFRDNLSSLNRLFITRHVICENPTLIEMHCFCDASEAAYGGCIYILSRNRQGDTFVNLLYAKTKVAPIKSLTIPKLELCRAFILAKLARKVIDSLKFSVQLEIINGVTWIVNKTQLTFLVGFFPISWLISFFCELRPKRATCLLTTEKLVFPFEKFSSLSKLKRVTSWIYRFVENCRKPKEERNCEPLHYASELKALLSGDSISKSNILNLSPFVDQDRILQVEGRLRNSRYVFGKKHPILPCPKCLLSLLIFRSKHVQLYHVGSSALLAAVRDKFWITSGRNLAKDVKNCKICFRQNSEVLTPIMGQLPKSRFACEFPFNATGTDYASPFLIKDKRGRGTKLSKAYLCIFICFSNPNRMLKVGDLELIKEDHVPPPLWRLGEQ